MKKTIVFALACATLHASAQMKLFSGGLQSYGSSTAPSSGEKHHFTGDVVVSDAGTTTSLCPLIRGNGGTTTYASSATRPDYTWLGNNNTGIFHPASNVVALTLGGSEKWRFHSNGQLYSTVNVGSASTPEYGWSADPNTGLFHIGGDIMGISTGGTERARINSDGNLLVGTTTDNTSRLKVENSGLTAGYFKATYSSDWGAAVTEMETNRSNSTAQKVTLTGTGTTYYVAGAGWIWSQGNYLGSDRNIKDDIRTIDSAASKLQKITGVTYKLKREKQNPAVYGEASEYMGVIAQEVEAVAPQAVKTLEDGTKAVCYEMLVGLLIEGFKEQDAKIERLENDLNNCCTKTSDGSNNRSINSSSTDNTGNISIGKSYLAQNRPNPFQKETVIDYNIVENGTAAILIFDMNGKLLKTIPVKIPGKGSITINGGDFQPGMYHYSLIVNDTEIDTKRMILTQ